MDVPDGSSRDALLSAACEILGLRASHPSGSAPILTIRTKDATISTEADMGLIKVRQPDIHSHFLPDTHTHQAHLHP